MDWTARTVEEVAPGVHRIPLPMPHDGLRAVNVYAVPGPDGVTLIDGGWRIEEASAALDEALATLGLAVADVRRCLVTHHHRDHYTLATELRRRAGTRLSLSEGERTNLALARQPGARALTAQRRLLEQAGAAELLRLLEAQRASPVEPSDYEDPDDWLLDEHVVPVEGRKLRVQATPGHTRGHVVYIDDAAELAFTGDHVLPHITPSVGFESDAAPSPLADYLRSLARTLAEPDRTMLPAHGPAGGSVRARTAELLNHHEVRLTATADAVRAGADTTFAVANVLRWTRRERRLEDLDPLNQMLAVLETGAHLEVLRAQDRVAATLDGTVLHWRC